MKNVILFIFFSVIAVFSSKNVMAQNGPNIIDADSHSSWLHKNSDVSLPPQLLGFKRGRIADYSNAQWDVAANYANADNDTELSVYIYQPAVQDVSLLFEQAKKSIEIRTSHYTNIVPLKPPYAFAPKGDPVASGLRVTFQTDGAHKSTALAVAPLGTQWAAKFRLSSASKNATELDALLNQFLDAFSWPEKAVPHRPATLIKPCTTSFPEFKIAKPLKDKNMGISSMIMAVVPDEGGDVQQPLCSENTQSLGSLYKVYRRDTAEQYYILALGDGGKALVAKYNVLATEMNKKGKSEYSVKLIVPGAVVTYPNYDALPSPSQALDIVQNASPTGEIVRDGAGNINIFSGGK